jgi:aryl-alcohol dehydrogenase-like predicted oxidoreductase
VAKANDFVNHGGLPRQPILQAVEASLKRLETHYMDLLQIHHFDKDIPIEETIEALHDLVRIGKVRYISGHYSQPLQGYGYSPARSSRGLRIPASRW